MKFFLIGVFLLFFALSHSQINQPQTWKGFALQGKIKFIEENYVAKKKKNRETTTLEFSPKGKILKKEEISKSKKPALFFRMTSRTDKKKYCFEILIKINSLPKA